MKKLRILPSVLMLVACIAVLCVGVLSIKPIENTIGGTINITAAKANVEVSCYINGQQVMAPTKTVGGVDFTIPSEYLNFDVSNVSSVDLAPQKILRVRIENEGSEQLGAFFYNAANGLGSDGLATYDSLAKELPINNAQGKQVAKATFSPYAHLAPNSYVDLYAIIELTTLSDSADSATFAFDVNVENYVPNVVVTDMESGYVDITSIDERFAKLPLTFTVDAAYLTFYDMDGEPIAEVVECVIPNTSYYSNYLPVLPKTIKHLLIPEVCKLIIAANPVPSNVEMLQTSTLKSNNDAMNENMPFGIAFGGNGGLYTLKSYYFETGVPIEQDSYSLHSPGTISLKTLIVNDKNGVEGLYGVSGGTSAKENGSSYSEVTGTPWNHTLENLVFGPDVESLAYKVPAKNVVIPAGLKASAYSDMAINSFVQNLTFGEGITTLGGSIANNTSLKALHLPSSLNTLTTNCHGLTSLDLLYVPDSVQTFGAEIFDNSVEVSLGDNYDLQAFGAYSNINVIFRGVVGDADLDLAVPAASWGQVTILNHNFSWGCFGYWITPSVLVIGEAVTSISDVNMVYNAPRTIIVKAGEQPLTGTLPSASEMDPGIWTRTVNGESITVTSLSRDANYDTIYTVTGID